MKTQLFIEGYEIELNESVQFLINKQFEEISNPTIIINDWSKTISIPMTVNNNKIFGYIYKPEMVIVEGDYRNMGIYFDPTKKLDFRLIYNSVEIMTGYAKMNEIKQKGEKGEYNITLFGQLGKIFQELKKITFDTTTTDTDYLIDGSLYVQEKINRSLVYSSWTSDGQIQSQLYPRYFYPAGSTTPVTHPAYHVTDIIGFAPNNAFCENFKYDTFQVNANKSNTYENALGDTFKQATGVDPKTVIPNGLLPREVGEYRSYHQLPFIYWNKLFQIFQAKAEALTGYTFELDSSWFNTTNPYWYNLVYMLQGFPFSKKGQMYNNIYSLGFGQGTQQSSSVTWVGSWNSTVWMESKDFNYFFANESSSVEVLPMCDWEYEFSNWTLAANTQTVFLLPMMISLYDWDPTRNNYLNNDNALVITINMVNPTTNANLLTQKVLVKTSSCTLTETDATVVIDDNKLDPNIWTKFEVYFDTSDVNYTGDVQFKVRMKWKTQTKPTTGTSATSGTNYQMQIILHSDTSKNATVNVYRNMFKSGSKFILNDLWNNDYNIFEEILKYCKMYRILITVDDFEKKIKFTPFRKYFQNYTISDWTDKLDKSKEYIVTPVTFEDKYVLFNYKDSETQLSKEYKDKYGFNYGEYRLTTDYNFNTNTKNLFENISQSITNTDNVLSYNNLYSQHKIIYSFPAELYVYNKDKDNKQKDIFGSFYFHKGTKEFDTEIKLNLPFPFISDDTDFQLANNTYFYNAAGGDGTRVDIYPFLDIVYGNYLCIFNIPKENYTYNNNYAYKYGIYENCWKNYLDERYSIQNKIVTCYLRLTPKDWIDFEFNHFVKIDGVLYIVNKIYDYNIESTESTLVELITVSDITGYTD